MLLLATIGSLAIHYFSSQNFEIADKPAGAVYYTEQLSSANASFLRYHQPVATVKPLIESQFRGIVKQAYDYSCGSAALTTLLNGYANQNLGERQIMDGLLKYGEYDRIIERRSFSLLDMKRYVTAIGFNGGGFKGSFKDLTSLDKPAIVPIAYAGFKHFVVYKGHREGRVFVADPALGNISFTDAHFQEVWDNNTLFIITLSENQASNNMLALQDADLRIVDDSTIDQFAFAEVRFANRTIEHNADRASTMQRVIDADPDSETYKQPIDTSLRLYYKRK